MSELHAQHLANALMVFFASLAAAALILAALNSPVETILSTSDSVITTSKAETGVGFIEQFWNALPFIVVFLGLIQLLGAAALEARP